MKWTNAQKQTIETREKNILVSAAAGSGKTTVMIERIKQLVLREGTDIDRFLITTFTNAAASEMKEKMERAIRQEMDAEKSGTEKRAFLQRQMDLLPRACIGTFHTFALGIIRDYFYLTDLQPGFVIGDETRLSIMRKDAVDEVFERRFEEDRDAFRAFLRTYSGDRNDERLKGQILGVYQEMRSIPGYMEWAHSRTRRMRMDDPMHQLGIDRFLLEESADALRDAERWLEAAAQMLDREDTGSLFLKARQDQEMIRMLREKARAACEAAEEDGGIAERLEALVKELDELKYNSMRASKDEKPSFDEIKDEVNRLRDRGKKCITDLKKKYFRQSPEENNEILCALSDDTEYFIGLVEEFEQVYRDRKREKNLIDFDDCMHYAIRILEDAQAAADYRDRFEFIFIDEYQDSNLLQEEIIGRIARENNLFMVGDVKQSIYKFRLAEPEIFRDRYEAYRSGSDPNSVRIDLNNNFRSRKTIRDAVNRIFEVNMDGYDEDAQLNGPDPEEGPAGWPVSLHILDTETDDTHEDPAEELTEMQVIAAIIRDSVGKTITGRDGSARTIDYGDIAVLSRGRDVIPRIERYLNNEGIPAYGETAGGYYETVEIQVFLNLLKVISNRFEDVPLISAMSSVVFDFTPRELARIRIECREGSFASAVAEYEKTGSSEEIRSKIRDMMGQIDLWKEIGRTVSLDELMRILLYETGYYDYCSGLPTGDQRVSNLRLLLERAAAYEETSHLGLYGFLEYVEAMRKTNQKVSEASLVSEGRSVVHVMTVHKSKGLEFPVVILVGAGKEIRGSSAGKAPAMHKAFAVGLPEIHRDMHWERRTILQKAIAGKKTREDLEEEIRILYVALTRPMDRLAIVGSVKDASKLQRFPGRKSFLEMIYGVLCQMAEEDPASAEVIMHDSQELLLPAAKAGESPPDEEAPPAVPAGSGSPKETAPAGEPDECTAAEIDRRLSYRYPSSEKMNVRTKYSVTALAKMEAGAGEEAAGEIPVLRNLEAAAAGETAAATLSAAEIGTAMHAVMERIDFRRAMEEGLPYIKQTIDQLYEAGILTDDEARAADPENIDAFFRTPLGRRAAGADKLFREKEFLLSKEIEGTETIVQGIIDCYFEDEQGLVLIDYKNSWAGSDEQEAEVIRRYGGQIRLYREALELALGRKVSESWLYLFRSRRFINMDE